MNKELSVNITLSHYRIVSKISAGGMGEVYLAQDISLNRKVALEFLPLELTDRRDNLESYASAQRFRDGRRILILQ